MYKPNSTKLDFLMTLIHVLYYIIFPFKHGLSSFDLWEKLRKCGLEGMGRFFSDLLHEPNSHMLPSGQGTLVTPQAHGVGLVLEIFTPKEFLCSG